MPRKKHSALSLLQEQERLDAEQARLRELKAALTHKLMLLRREEQLAWEAKVGRLATNAGLSQVPLEELVLHFEAIAMSLEEPTPVPAVPMRPVIDTYGMVPA